MRAPTALAPAEGCGALGPKSGTQAASFSFSARPSNWPRLTSSRFFRCGPRRFLVEEDRNPEPLGHGFAHVAGERNAVLHRGPLDGDEGHDVDRAHARVLSLVRPQVDPRRGDLEEGEEARLQGSLLAHQGEDAPVVVLVRLHTQDADARGGLEGLDRLGDDLGAPALAEVRDALDDPWHERLVSQVSAFLLENRRRISP